MRTWLRVWWVALQLRVGMLPHGWEQRSSRLFVSDAGWRVKYVVRPGLRDGWRVVRPDGVFASPFPFDSWAEAMLLACSFGRSSR